MEHKNNQGVPTPGVADAAQAAKETVSVETVKEWSKRDLSVAIGFLNAILSDPDLLEHIAHFVHGRFSNAQNAKEERLN